MPTIGGDEWVSEVGERTAADRGPAARLRRLAAPVPWAAWLAAFVALAALLPLTTSSSFVVRVALNALLFALLAMGLNTVVGYAGLLDLGYIAFYGFGAYGYALLSSEQFGVHLPTELTIALVVVATAVLGVLLGLPSRRLVGDYLAIVTLFFGQAFVQVVTNLDRLSLPGADGPLDVTGGPNGIAGLDRMRLLGVTFVSVRDYYWLLLAVFAVVITLLHNLDASRTGRAWRALREDPLAAELMTVPVARLKLLAFAVGGATAGLTGTIFAAVQVGVFPANFSVTLLVMVYAAVVLGGTGSLPGVVLGAAVISIVPEVLRTPEQARLIFYGVLLATLLVVVRPWWRAAAILGATAVLGFAVRVAVSAAWPESLAAGAAGGGLVADAAGAWVVVQPDLPLLANAAFVALVAAALGLTLLGRAARTVALVPVLYLAAYVWENRLVTEPSITRQLLLGAILVVMMNVRPQGLLGTPRVEIV